MQSTLFDLVRVASASLLTKRMWHPGTRKLVSIGGTCLVCSHHHYRSGGVALQRGRAVEIQEVISKRRTGTMAEFSKWKLDFTSKAISSKKSGVVDPPGYEQRVFNEIEEAHSNRKNGKLDSALLARKELALRSRALEPLKQVGMMCFMLYMSGNTLQLFSIMMLSSCVYSPIQAISNVTKAIPPNNDVDVMIPRLLYCLVYLGQLAFAAYKLDCMGLLPTYPSDWSSQLKAPVYLERSYGPRSPL